MRGVVFATLAAALLAALGAFGAGEALADVPPLKPVVKVPVATGQTGPLSSLPNPGLIPSFATDAGDRSEQGVVVTETVRGLFRVLAGDGGMVSRHTADGALQSSAVTASTTPAPLFTFEGPSNQDNFNVHGFRVNPPDPVGDVGKDQYVAMVNLVFSRFERRRDRYLRRDLQPVDPDAVHDAGADVLHLPGGLTHTGRAGLVQPLRVLDR
jgi:hypothetical protein